MLILVAILPALAHPTVDAHLHAVDVDCTDPLAGTVASIRRAGVLADDGRTDEALAELDAACLPGEEITRLARARTLLLGRRPQAALDALDGLSGTDADLWRARALAALDRGPEAYKLLSHALRSGLDAPPETWLMASEHLPPCDAATLLSEALASRGDVGTLRRARALSAHTCGLPDALVGLHPDDPRDLLLAGDTLVAHHPAAARERWQQALRLLEDRRDTPAHRHLQEEVGRRLASQECAP